MTDTHVTVTVVLLMVQAPENTKVERPDKHVYRGRQLFHMTDATVVL